MTDHDAASRQSAALCEALCKALSASVPGLRRRQTKRWCAFRAPGGRRVFAYVTHRARQGRIEVWCLGASSELAAAARSLRVVARRPTGGNWPAYGARFYLESPTQISEACRILSQVSVPRSRGTAQEGIRESGA